MIRCVIGQGEFFGEEAFLVTGGNFAMKMKRYAAPELGRKHSIKKKIKQAPNNNDDNEE